jgi:hypothetical protein
MPKTVSCPVAGFPGVVVFHDPLNMEQVFAIEDANDGAFQLEPSPLLTAWNKSHDIKDDTGNTVQASWSSRADNVFLRAIFLCVKEWKIEGLPDGITPETFPFTPRHKSHEMIDWLMKEINRIYEGETQIPNA